MWGRGSASHFQEGLACVSTALDPCDDVTGTDRRKPCPRRRPALVHRLTGRRAAQAFLRRQTSRFRFHRGCVALPGVVKNLTRLLTPTHVQGRLLAGAAQLGGRSPAPGPTLTHGVRSCPLRPRGPPGPADGPRLQMACCDSVQKQMAGAGGQLLSTQRSRQALLSKPQGQGLSVFRKTTENVKLSCETVSREPLWKSFLCGLYFQLFLRILSQCRRRLEKRSRLPPRPCPDRLTG